MLILGRYQHVHTILPVSFELDTRYLFGGLGGVWIIYKINWNLFTSAVGYAQNKNEKQRRRRRQLLLPTDGRADDTDRQTVGFIHNI